jgi:hypothetical protein
MSDLLRAQITFAKFVPRLVDRAIWLGFQVTGGEWYRPDATADLFASEGRASRASLHPLRLAIDLHLFRDGVFLTDTESHRPLGEWWERVGIASGVPLRWGGRFRRPDGNHYSHAWGVRA